MITIVVGSQRTHSTSARLAARIADLVTDHILASRVETIDLARSKVPVWSDEFGLQKGESWDQWRPYSRILHGSDAFVLVVPEWGGMVPPALKNLFLLCDGSLEFADKPALLVGVSSTSGGSYPVAELRMSSYKNTRICYIPEQVIVRDVNELFDRDAFVATPEAKRLQRQLLHSILLLEQYGKALALVRDSHVRDRNEFRWGA